MVRTYMSDDFEAFLLTSNSTATIFNDFVPGLTNEDRVKPYVLQQGGKKYRLRFVNMSAFTPFLVKIIGHVVQLIEIDGIELDPTSSAETEGFIIAPGQRVSALLTSLTSSTETFSIIAVLGRFHQPQEILISKY